MKCFESPSIPHRYHHDVVLVFVVAAAVVVVVVGVVGVVVVVVVVVVAVVVVVVVVVVGIPLLRYPGCSLQRGPACPRSSTIRRIHHNTDTYFECENLDID